MGNFWAMSKDPRHFKDPDVFDPDRFMSGNLKGTAFQPFGSGRRMCPGDQFATNSLMVAMSKLVRYFYFVLDGPEPDLSIAGGYGTGLALSPKALPVNFHPRNV